MKKYCYFFGVACLNVLLVSGCGASDDMSKETDLNSTSQENSTEVSENKSTGLESDNYSVLQEAYPNDLLKMFKSNEPGSFDYESAILDGSNNVRYPDVLPDKGTVAMDPNRIGKKYTNDFGTFKEVNVNNVYYRLIENSKIIDTKKPETISVSSWNSMIFDVSLDLSGLYKTDEGTEVFPDGNTLSFVQYNYSKEIEDDFSFRRVYFTEDKILYGIAEVIAYDNSKTLMRITNVTQNIPEDIFDVEGYSTDENTIDLT